MVWGARDSFLYKETCELRHEHADELGKERKGWREDVEEGEDHKERTWDQTEARECRMLNPMRLQPRIWTG